MRENEKQFLKTKSTHRDNRELLRIYKFSQNSLDKRIRYYERRWRRGVAIEIDEISVCNPRKFWDKIKHLGPKKKAKTPNECMDNGTVTSGTAFLKQKYQF